MTRRHLLNYPIRISLGLIVLLILLSVGPIGDRFENHIFDLFMKWTINPKRWSKDVVVVLIDDQALKYFGPRGWRWPWPRDAHSALLAGLKQAGARVVLFDIIFPEESKDAMEDDRFASYLAAVDNAWLAVVQQSDGSLIEPIAPLKQAVKGRLGLVNADKNDSGVIRWYGYGLEEKIKGFKLLACTQAKHTGSFLIRWVASSDQLANAGYAFSAGPIVARWLKVVDQLKEKKGLDEMDPHQISEALSRFPASQEERQRFEDKIVVVGCGGAALDAIATPLEGNAPGPLSHAMALSNMIQGDWLIRANRWLVFFLNLSLVLMIPSFCAYEKRIWRQTLAVTLLLLLLAGLSYFLFYKGIWLPPLAGMVTCFVSFTAITIYNYILESKERRMVSQLFSDFVSPDVLDQIQHGDLNLKGDRRIGSVLFCDLEGFTSFAEKSSPEQLFEVINGYLSEASQVLLKYDAYVDKFIGDAVMAVFGVLKPMTDHPVHACLAALDLQKMMADLNERLGQRYGLKLGLRVGIESGEMTAGPLGYARKLNYSVLGDSVNLASRLEGANKSFHTRIMIGNETYEQAKVQIEARPLDLLRVKGKEHAVPVYELLARKGELTAVQKEVCTNYLEGLKHYRLKNWDAAIDCFEQALKHDPSDGPSQVYLERCKELKVHPPRLDWDGSFSLDSK